MSSVYPIREGFRTVTPHMTVDGCSNALDFYEKAFGAEILERVAMPGDGKGRLMHALMRVGDSMIMLNDDFPEMSGGESRDPASLGGSPVTIHLSVADADAAWERATEAGCEVTFPLADQFWGDRYGVVRDPFGHTWSIGQRIADPTPEEMAERMRRAGIGG